MTNFEKYKNEILKIIRNTNSSPGMKNGKLYNCGQLRCSECDFGDSNGKYNELSCSPKFIVWMYDEYEERPVLTEREYNLCKAITNGWITRDEDEALYFTTDKPYKSQVCWDTKRLDCPCCNLGDLGFTKTHFPFIKWEDEEPWSVEKLLELEVVNG